MPGCRAAESQCLVRAPVCFVFVFAHWLCVFVHGKVAARDQHPMSMDSAWSVSRVSRVSSILSGS